MKKIGLGMSGGVDSSVSCLLLKEMGYDVVGVTMYLLPPENLYKNKRDAFSEAIIDAKKVAEDLNVDHHVVYLQEEFNKKVINTFVKEYSQGLTPNPCVTCNKYIKFSALRREMKKLGTEYIATGHYARIEYDKNKKRYLLKKAKDTKKDQTYFLYTMTQEALSETIFPLGELEKEEVRKIGKKNNVVVHDKKDSEEICFIEKDDHGLFIKNRNPEMIKPGNFIDEQGNVIGKHKGIVYYTLGQRRGLGIALGKRVFVSKIDLKENTITISDEKNLYKKYLEVGNYNLISIDDINKPIKASVKIRHGLSEYKAIVSKNGDKLLFEFEQPVRAPAKGQSAVMYDGDIIVGGGIIEKAW